MYQTQHFANLRNFIIKYVANYMTLTEFYKVTVSGIAD